MYKRILILGMCFFLSFMMMGCQKEYVGHLEEIKIKPTLDFIQPWKFCEYTELQMRNHFEKLKGFGIDTVIIQNVANFDKGVMTNSYYDTAACVARKYPSFLDTIFLAADATTMKVILGLSSDSNWWDYTTHHYNKETMEMYLRSDLFVFEELSNKYQPDGWYLTNEMYSNPYGFEENWSDYVNNILSKIEIKTPNLPFYMSPFQSGSFKMSISQIEKMWISFFQKVHFRNGDVFMPQDGYGGTTSEYREKQATKINQINDRIGKACLQYSLANYYLNIELFCQGGYAEIERVMYQIAFANQIAKKLACFSISHYYILDDVEKGNAYIKVIQDFCKI